MTSAGEAGSRGITAFGPSAITLPKFQRGPGRYFRRTVKYMLGNGEPKLVHLETQLSVDRTWLLHEINTLRFPSVEIGCSEIITELSKININLQGEVTEEKESQEVVE